MKDTADNLAPRLAELLEQRILLIDGSMGALLMSKGLTDADYRGKRFAQHAVDLKNATDILCLTQPDLIADVTPAAAAELGLVPGRQVWLSVKETAVRRYTTDPATPGTVAP